MDFTTWTVEALEERRAAIALEVDEEGADMNALEEEVRAINEELKARKEQHEKREEIRKMIAKGKGTRIDAPAAEGPAKKTLEEIRSSKEYIDAFANYIRTEDPTEVRALLTDNVAGGTIPVPTMVDDVIRHAWEKEGIMKRVRRISVKANFEVGFEISGSDAQIHTEGGEAVSEEELGIGKVEMKPATIKKWISVSDEVLDMKNEQFLEYIYSELAYRIFKKAASRLIGKIIACGTVSTTTCPSVPVVVATTPTMALVASAIANLSDEANKPIIMMNKLSWSEFKSVQYANGYGADPFEGLEIEFNDSIASLTAATTGVTWMIVGDLDQGALANFPNGDDITFKLDDLTLATSDLVKVIGRLPVAEEVVAPKAFVKITK